MAHVLVSPLNWGLGHATRDIPVIHSLLRHNHDVTIAACGNARAVLEKEFPDLAVIEFPDYPVPYSSSRFFLPKFFASFPLMLKAISDERKNLVKILEKDRYDLIVSDNRLGVYSPEIPSVFITHQLHYHLPLAFWPVELLAVEANGYHHEKFRHIIVPDSPPGPAALAGKLSRPGTEATIGRAYFAGILTGMHRQELPTDLDYLVLISGPEPQRQRLEEILMPQINNLPGKRVVLLGSPGNTREREQSGDCTVISYASTEEKGSFMNRARTIICRSGYTSMMEIAELDKKRALLIPTPGQTEQEYLSSYYEKNGWFHSVSQYHLRLAEDISATRNYNGFPAIPGTRENVERLYDDILAQYLGR